MTSLIFCGSEAYRHVGPISRDLARVSLYGPSMKVGISVWDDRVSPLFDVAKRLLVIDIQEGLEVNRREVAIEDTDLAARTRWLVGLKVSVLICGAISRPMEDMLVSAGIQVIAQTCGPIENVLRAFLRGPFNRRTFLIPGSHRRRKSESGRTNRAGREAPGKG